MGGIQSGQGAKQLQAHVELPLQVRRESIVFPQAEDERGDLRAVKNLERKLLRASPRSRPSSMAEVIKEAQEAEYVALARAAASRAQPLAA